tara:strand:- start:1829 stop:4495 length:2667 start_codon:yes stop_codon:yes gene_type:complete
LLSNNGEADSTATLPCSDGSTNGMVACVLGSAQDTGEGLCMRVHGEPSDVVNLGGDVAAGALQIRVPADIGPGDTVDFLDTVLVPSASNALLAAPIEFRLQGCGELARDGFTCENVVGVSAGAGAVGRRLLSAVTEGWDVEGMAAALLAEPGAGSSNGSGTAEGSRNDLDTTSQKSQQRPLDTSLAQEPAEIDLGRDVDGEPGVGISDGSGTTQGSRSDLDTTRKRSQRKLLDTSLAQEPAKTDLLKFDFESLGLGGSSVIDLVNVELPPQCTNDKSAEVSIFLRRTAQILAGEGWRAKPVCSDAEEQQRYQQVRNQPCPWVTSIAESLVNNTQTLVQYYTRAREPGGCLVNSSKSCLPQSERKFNTSSALWPVFPEHNFTTVGTQYWLILSRSAVEDNMTENVDARDKIAAAIRADCSDLRINAECSLSTPVSNLSQSFFAYQYVLLDGEKVAIPNPAPDNTTTTTTPASDGFASTTLVGVASDIVEAVLALFNVDGSFYNRLFFNMISLEASYHDGEYARQVREGQYTIGRMLREFFRCDFDDMITCKQQNHSLLLSFCTMFFFILVITLVLPLPSVLTFFLWTLGLTLGTLYRAYGYSPWCAPLIPNCLGQGVSDLVGMLAPETLALPEILRDEKVCNENGTRKEGVDAAASCLKRCENEPLEMKSGLDAWMFAEAMFNGGSGLGSRWALVPGASSTEDMPSGWAELLGNVGEALPDEVKAPDWGQFEIARADLKRARELRDTINATGRYGFEGRVWRPVHGLPVTETLLLAGRNLLHEWVGDEIWEGAEASLDRAVDNGWETVRNTNLAVATVLCITFHSADVVALVIAILIGLPIAVYVVQYFVLLNLVVLQIFLDNFVTAGGLGEEEESEEEAEEELDEDEQ